MVSDLLLLCTNRKYILYKWFGYRFDSHFAWNPHLALVANGEFRSQIWSITLGVYTLSQLIVYICILQAAGVFLNKNRIGNDIASDSLLTARV